MIHTAHDWPEILGEVLGQPGRVRPHFQPVVDLQRGEVCGYEALARFPGRTDLRPPTSSPPPSCAGSAARSRRT